LRLSATLGVGVGTSGTKGVPGLSRVIPSTVGIREPDPAVRAEYPLYRKLSTSTSTSTTATVHALADREKRTIRTTTEEPR
jgi:hypothetical protein